MNRTSRIRFASLAVAAGLAVGGAQAAVINKNVGTVSTIPGLTGFNTTGAMMSGLQITANFAGGFTETRFWATTGAASGGVTGTGWGLSLDGDSFTSDWDFVFAPGASLQLLSLVIDGTNALTVLDTTNPSTGTPGSSDGADFRVTSDAALDAASTANYSSVVAVSPDAPVGDLFQVLRVTLGNGTRTNFSFRQDTDNDARFGVPEPGSLALVGMALAGLGMARRRRG